MSAIVTPNGMSSPFQHTRRLRSKWEVYHSKRWMMNVANIASSVVVVNNGHHHIASLSYAMKGTLNGLQSLQKGKKTSSPSNGQQMTKRIREPDIKNMRNEHRLVPRASPKAEIEVRSARRICVRGDFRTETFEMNFGG